MVAPATREKRPTPITVLLWYHFILGGLCLPLAIALAVMPPKAVLDSGIELLATWFYATKWVALGIAMIVTRVGILRLRPWAYKMAILLGFAILLSFPFGTLAGWLVLRYLASPPGRRAFQQPVTQYQATLPA